MNTELEYTAYHEAGHAVASLMLGYNFRNVSITPNKDSLGRVLIDEIGSLGVDGLGCTKKDKKLITIALAGTLAESEYHLITRKKAITMVGTRRDYKKARVAFEKLTNNKTDDSNSFHNVIDLAERILFVNWKAVDEIAKQLLEQDSLSFDETDQLAGKYIVDVPM